MSKYAPKELPTTSWQKILLAKKTFGEEPDVSQWAINPTNIENFLSDVNIKKDEVKAFVREELKTHGNKILFVHFRSVAA